MERPKVIVFTTAYYPFVGGAEIAIEEICKRLKDRFNFYIVTARLRRDLPKVEVRSEGTVVRLGFGTPLDKWFLPILGPFYYRGFASIVFGVDLGQGSLAAALLKRIQPSVRFILNIQYGGSEMDLSRGYLGLHGLLFRSMLSRADYVTAISKYLLYEAKKYGYGGPAEIIHNGVDIDKFKIQNSKFKNTNQKSKIIITTSRLVPKNGIDILIKAVAEVKKTIPDIRCHIIGEGEERSNLELEIRNLKLEENVKLFGQVPHEELPRYLSEASLFVRPSRSEGMGNSFVEALAVGVPIIGTPVGGITDIIEDGKTGLFAKVDDPKDLSQKIIRILSDRELMERIVGNGQRMVNERFSWVGISAVYGRIFADFARKPVSSILIATPLLPPQVGGPAQYAENLSKEFSFLGHRVKVVSFGKYLRFPSVIRHLLYFSELARNALNCSVILALDYTSVGFPAAIASMIFRRPLIIRVEGDFLWESFVERTRKDMTLREFYENPPRLLFKEKLIKFLSGWTLRRAKKLVFSSNWRRQMILGTYRIPEEKTEIISNAFPPAPIPTHEQRGNIILWAGRILYLKNLQRLIRAFADINVSSYKLHLVGDGPERENLEHLVKEYHAEDRIKFFPSMSHKELMEKLAVSTAVVLPSLSDVGPNIVAEAIATLVPVIMTKESGYAEIFHGNVVFIDPLDETDIRQKLEKFIKEPAQRIMPKIGIVRSWAAAAKDWTNLFKLL